MTLPIAVCDTVIDVSHNNGTIDFAAVAAAGITFAFVKASEGTGFVDPLYQANIRGFASVGIDTGAYHFIDAAASAEAQAAFFVKTAGLGPGNVAVMDWEVSGFDGFARFMYAVEQATRRNTVGYYGAYQLAAADPTMSASPLWLPEYPAGGTPGDYAQLVKAPPNVPPGRPAVRPYDFHQYTGTGRVAGIAGDVDRSIWVGTIDQLRAWHRSGSAPT